MSKPQPRLVPVPTVIQYSEKYVNKLLARIEWLELAREAVPKAVKWSRRDLPPFQLVHNNKLLAGWEAAYRSDV